MEAILVRPKSAGQGQVLSSLFREMGVPFETGEEGRAPKKGIPLEALKSIAGLFREEFDKMPEGQFEEMLRDTHR